MNFKKCNIIFPLCGNSVKLQTQNIWTPKPLYNNNILKTINGLNNRNLFDESKFIFIVKEEDHLKFAIKQYLLDYFPDSTVILSNRSTHGNVDTILLSTKFIDNTFPSLVVYGDAKIRWNPYIFSSYLTNKRCDIAILTNSMPPEINSDTYFASHNSEHLVSSVHKELTDCSLCGAYYFNKGNTLIDYCYKVIKNNNPVFNEFTIEQVINHCINDGARVGNYCI